MEYSFEFLALVLFIVVLAGILWIFEKTSEAGRNIMATLDSPSVKSDEQQVAEDLAFRNKAVYEADRYNEAASMEPLAHGKVGGINPSIAAALIGARVQQTANAYQSDDYNRRLNAGIQNQRKAEQPAEPPKTAQEAAFHDLMLYGTGVMHTSPSGETRHVPLEEYFSGGGGSFDGGGSSGDWGGSSSSSSSSSDCSNSSSDSGSISCSSSD